MGKKELIEHRKRTILEISFLENQLEEAKAKLGRIDAELKGEYKL